MFRSMASLAKQVVKTGAPALGYYSPAVVVTEGSKMLYVSGQLGVDMQTKVFVANDVAGQTKQALENLKFVLEKSGTDMSNVVKTTVLLDDIANFQKVNEIYKTFFPEDEKKNMFPPARTCYAVKDLPLNGLVEIEAIAIVPNNK